MTISNIVEFTWLLCYPRPTDITVDRGFFWKWLPEGIMQEILWPQGKYGHYWKSPR